MHQIHLLCLDFFFFLTDSTEEISLIVYFDPHFNGYLHRNNLLASIIILDINKNVQTEANVTDIKRQQIKY